MFTITLRLLHDFYINGERFVVSKIHSSVEFELRGNSKVYLVQEDSWVQLTALTRVSAGVPRTQNMKIVRVVVDSSEHILRGEVYRKEAGYHANER